MAQFTINIDTNTLRTTAGEVRTISNDLKEKLEEIQTTMGNLSVHWMSDAAEDIRANMNSLADRFFERYKMIVDSYAEFLERTAESYESTESTLQTNASAFK